MGGLCGGGRAFKDQKTERFSGSFERIGRFIGKEAQFSFKSLTVITDNMFCSETAHCSQSSAAFSNVGCSYGYYITAVLGI